MSSLKSNEEVDTKVTMKRSMHVYLYVCMWKETILLYLDKRQPKRAEYEDVDKQCVDKYPFLASPYSHHVSNTLKMYMYVHMVYMYTHALIIALSLFDRDT